MAYEFNFAGDDWENKLPDEAVTELIPIFRKLGYLGDSWYEKRLDWSKQWHPKLFSFIKKYGSIDEIPVEEFGSLEPNRISDVAVIIANSNRLIHLHSPHVFETEQGYGHALQLISNALCLEIENISYVEKTNTESTFTLTCLSDGNEFKVGLRYAEYRYPKKFLQYLYEIMESSSKGEFLFFDRDDNPSYTFIDKELAAGLQKYGFIKPVLSKPEWT